MSAHSDFISRLREGYNSFTCTHGRDPQAIVMTREQLDLMYAYMLEGRIVSEAKSAGVDEQLPRFQDIPIIPIGSHLIFDAREP